MDSSEIPEISQKFDNIVEKFTPKPKKKAILRPEPRKVCGKIVYKCRNDAKAQANIMERLGKLMKGIYFCPTCDGYHLTKMTRKQFLKK